MIDWDSIFEIVRFIDIKMYLLKLKFINFFNVLYCRENSFKEFRGLIKFLVFIIVNLFLLMLSFWRFVRFFIVVLIILFILLWVNFNIWRDFNLCIILYCNFVSLFFVRFSININLLKLLNVFVFMCDILLELKFK